MKRLILILVLGQVIALSARAQLQVVPALNVPQFLQQLPNLLFDSTVTVTNMTFAGDSTQIGTFNGTATVLGLDTGVIMSSGSVLGALGPNNDFNFSLGGGNFGASDIDLASLMAPSQVNDAAVLEFDATCMEDTFRLGFVFGSEEYLENVNAYNDAIGIFISGPGIVGPYSNSATNIALVPGTNEEVCVNNVNNFDNSSFYINNGNGNNSPYNTLSIYPQYDGFSIPMIAYSAVQAGQVYHVKIAIGDAQDTNWDSGLFITNYGSAIGIDTSLITEAGGGEVDTFDHVYYNNGSIHLVGGYQGKGALLVLVVDLQGRHVVQRQVGGTSDRSVPLDLPTGCYVVTLVQGGRSTSKRIVVLE